MLVDFFGKDRAKPDPGDKAVVGVGGFFDDVEAFQTVKDSDHRSLRQPRSEINIRCRQRIRFKGFQRHKINHIPD